ncbi:helix-turn-helix domain-containing protein [Oscillibacter sp.]|uniref:helix-turn-helix domain-containing protein n=1 Tax=Oscillibacter sp. TaxID=1945593 RepID=UPI0028B15EC4|nr:helix-turn-helix domain-containing protein [Oscillibacter sp.]
MNHYVTGPVIRELREKKQLTQRQLAQTLCVSDKTISKWETGRGLPDVSLLEPLASALSVSVAELLSGECFVNDNRSGNLLRSKFYVCPICGNVLWAAGEGSFSCCGVNLPPLEAEEPDEAHPLQAQRLDGEWYVELDHLMRKDHFISFFALVTDNRTEIVRLYPEQNAEARFPERSGTLYACCNRHSLFKIHL